MARKARENGEEVPSVPTESVNGATATLDSEATPRRKKRVRKDWQFWLVGRNRATGDRAFLMPFKTIGQARKGLSAARINPPPGFGEFGLMKTLIID